MPYAMTRVTTGNRLLKSDELPLANVDEYLGGVLDFTGVLAHRLQVTCALCAA